MLENISISPELISEQKEEIRVLLEKLKKAEVSAQEGRKIRKKLRRLGFRLRDFVGKTGITKKERKKGIIRTAVEKKERIIKKSLVTPFMTKKEEERIRGTRELKYPSRPSKIKIIKHAIMLAQHKYDTPSKIADILVDTFVGLPRSEATKFAKVALGSYKKHPLIEHAGMIKENFPYRGKVIYDKILSIEAEKGSKSNFPHEQFRHDFNGSSEAKVIGLEDGSLLVKSTKGKRLWKELDYD